MVMLELPCSVTSRPLENGLFKLRLVSYQDIKVVVILL